jgi:hypothetical protein
MFLDEVDAAPSYAELKEVEEKLNEKLTSFCLNGDYEGIYNTQAKLKEIEPRLKAAEVAETKRNLENIDIELAEIDAKKAVLEDELKIRNREFVSASDIQNQKRIRMQECQSALYMCDSQVTNLRESRRDGNDKLKRFQKALLRQDMGV